MNRERERVVFKPYLYSKSGNYDFRLIEDAHKQDYLTLKAFVEIVEKFDIDFEIEKIENGLFFIENESISSVAEILLFISDRLQIELSDTILLIRYLIENDMVEIRKKGRISIKRLREVFKESNTFYKIECNNLEKIEDTSRQINITTETIFPKKIDIEKYTKSSHVIKYVQDIVFFHLLKYVRGVYERREKVYGSYRGCYFKFEGYENIHTCKKAIFIEKEYQSNNVLSEKIKELKCFEEISSFVKSIEKGEQYELYT